MNILEIFPISLVASNADGQMYQKVYVNPELLDQIGQYMKLLWQIELNDTAGINEKKVNSESPIIECGIACNLNVSCDGFFFAEDTCSTFQVNITFIHLYFYNLLVKAKALLIKRDNESF